jgi:hypothetical protein
MNALLPEIDAVLFAFGMVPAVTGRFAEPGWRDFD